MSDAVLHSALKKPMCEDKQDKLKRYLPIELSQQQAEARNLVLNEIKDLQLRRQSSFKRMLRMPPSWTNRLTTSPLASGENYFPGNARAS